MSQTSDRPLSQDVVFDLLSSSRRRFVLQYLNQQEGQVQFSELANELAAWENDTDVADITERQRKRVYVSLYQTHIPKLEESGVVDYDADTGEVRLSSQVGRLSAHLDADEGGFPWQLYFLGLAAASLLFYVGVLVEAPVLGAIPLTVAVVVIVLAFAASAVAQYVARRRGPTSYSR